MTRGWTSADLPAVGDDDTLWTISEAACLLGPLPGYPDTLPASVTETRLRLVAAAFPWIQACGKRRTSKPGRSGRYARTYRAQDLIRLYELLGAEVDKAPPQAA